MWVPLVENNEYNSDGADYFIRKHIDQLMSKSGKIDTILLACTHYPLLIDKIKKFAPKGHSILSQGEIVANSLVDICNVIRGSKTVISKNGKMDFYTTDSTEDFDNHAADSSESP